MSLVDETTRESWILKTFPQWGTWLNEEIEATVVNPGTLAMWWLGCTGLWIKTEGDANILIDLWVGTGKRTRSNPVMAEGHQMMRMAGGRQLQPNLRLSPFVIDPFAIETVDAVLASHSHSDHIDVNVAAAVLANCPSSVPFIGPKSAVDLWTKWGVPEDRCVCVKPGDSLRIKDTEIVALEAFDRTMLITLPKEQTARGNPVADMDLLAVNFLIRTPGGTVYDAADSHYSNMFARHGNEYDIDIALGAFGENPRGITDKLTAFDILRMAEALRTKVVIPVHHDIWSNFQANPDEIVKLWEMKRHALQYRFVPYIWQVGGKFVYPDNKDDREYHYPRGFEDAFENEPDLPFPAFL